METAEDQDIFELLGITYEDYAAECLAREADRNFQQFLHAKMTRNPHKNDFRISALQPLHSSNLSAPNLGNICYPAGTVRYRCAGVERNKCRASAITRLLVCSHNLEVLFFRLLTLAHKLRVFFLGFGMDQLLFH